MGKCSGAQEGIIRTTDGELQRIETCIVGGHPFHQGFPNTRGLLREVKSAPGVMVCRYNTRPAAGGSSVHKGSAGLIP